MFMDADDIFQAEKNFNLDFLLNDNFSAYNSRFNLNGIQFERTLFVNSLRGWRYEGVLHEFLKLEGDDNFFNQPESRPLIAKCALMHPLLKSLLSQKKKSI